MDLGLSDEQRLLRESAGRFATQRYNTEQRRKSQDSLGRWSREIWREIADLGWLAMAVSQEDGGIGSEPVELGIVAEAFGRALVLEPFLDAVLVTKLVGALGDGAQRARLLPPLLDGSRRPAFAHMEGSAFAAEPSLTQAVKAGAGFRLDGRKEFVSSPGSADDLYVTAKAGADRCAVFVVDPNSSGVSIRSFETVDGREAARVTFEGVEVDADAMLATGDVRSALAEALNLAVALLCAEAVGCMDQLLASTIAYTRTREQFGKPLAANQVLRHRMADMSVRCEEARAIALRALLHSGSPEGARAASGAKYKSGRCGQFVAESAIQLHGAMGVTEELDIGLYAKRLLAINLSFGAGDEHLRRHAMSRSR